MAGIVEVLRHGVRNMWPRLVLMLASLSSPAGVGNELIPCNRVQLMAWIDAHGSSHTSFDRDFFGSVGRYNVERSAGASTGKRLHP
jgi:hypothetical protein